MSMYSESNFASSQLIKKPSTSLKKKTTKLSSSTIKKSPSKTKVIKRGSVSRDQSDKIDELEEDLSQLQSFTDQLQNELQDKVRGYESLLTQQKEKSVGILQQSKQEQAELKAQIQQLQQMADQAREKQQQAQQDLQKCQLDMQTQQTTQMHQEKTIMQLEFDNQHQQDKIKSTAKQISIFEEDNTKLSSTLQKCQFALEQSENYKIETEKRINEQQQQVQALVSQLDHYKQTVSKAKTKITTLQDGKTELEAQNSKIKESYLKIKELYKKQQDEYKKVISEQKESEKSLADREKKIVKMQKDLDDHDVMMQQMKQSIQQKLQKQYQQKLEETHQQQRSQEQQLQEKLDYQTKRCQEEQNKLKTVEQQNADLQSQQQQLQLQFNQKQQEYLNTNTQLTEFKVRCATKDTILDETQQKLEKMKHHTFDVSNSSNQEEHKNQLLQLRSLYDDLKQKLNNEKLKQDDHHISSSQTVLNTVKELSAQNTILQDDLHNSKKQLQEIQNKNQNESQLHVQLKMKLDECERQLKYTKAEKDQLQFNNQRLKTELNQILDDLQRTQLNYNSLEQTVTKNDEDGSVQFLLKQQKDELIELQQQIKEQQIQINTHLQSIQNTEQLKQELEQQIQSVENEKESLRQQNVSLSIQIQSFTTQQLDYQNQIQVFNEFKSKHLDCQDKLDLLNNCNHEIKLLKAQLKDQVLEYKDLKSQHESTESQLNQIQQAQSQNIQQPQQLSESQLITNKQQYLCEQNLCPHQQQNELLQNMLQDIQNKYYTLQQELTTSQISKQHNTDEADLTKIQQQYEDQQSHLRKMYEEQMITLHDQIADLTLEVQEFRQKFPLLEQENDFLKMKNFENDNEITFIKQQLNDLQQQYNSDLAEQTRYQFQYEKSQQQILLLQSEIDAKDAQIEDKRNSVMQFQKKIEELQQQVEDYNTVVSKNNQLQLEKDHIQGQINMIQSQFQEQENRLLFLAEKEHAIVILEQNIQNHLLDVLNLKKINDSLNIEIQDNLAQIQTLQSKISEQEAMQAQFQNKLVKLYELEQENGKMQGMQEQIVSLTQKLSLLEMDKINQSKYLNTITEEKLKLQSSNMLLLNLHKSAIQSKLQMNFVTDSALLKAQLQVNENQKGWNLTIQEVKMLVEAKYVSNKSMKEFVLKYIDTQIKNDVTGSFYTGQSDFYRIEELQNFSDSLRLQIQKSGIDDCRTMFEKLKQLFQLVKLLQSHIFIIKNLAALLNIPNDFTRDKGLLNLDYLTIQKDSQNQSNILYSPHVSDYIFVLMYTKAVLQKVKSNWAKCESRVVELLHEGIELVQIEKCEDFQYILEDVKISRGGFIQRTSLYTGDALGSQLDLNLYYAMMSFLFLLDGCTQARQSVISGMSPLLGENDDHDYDLFYPAWLSEDGDVVAKGKGKIVR